MKPIVYISVIFTLGITLGVGCKPRGTEITGGGKGGNYTINITGEHHGGLLDTCMVYIKYASLEAPGNGVYDDSEKCLIINGTPVATFDSLLQGNYYVLAVGYHGAFSPPNVRGGKSITVSGPAYIVSDTIPTYQYSL